PISWQQAIDLAAKRLVETRDRFGGEAILPYSYGGSNGYLSQDSTDALLFSRLGASRLARTVCAAATGRAATGLYGKMEGVAINDYPAARLIVVWGANPTASGIHLVPPIQAACEAGAKLVVVDPRATALAKRADLHLAIRPGTDLVVALAVIRELFVTGRADRDFLDRHTTGADELERRAAPWTLGRAAEISGVPLADLERFVDLYATISPAVLRCGWGLERNRNGGSAVAAVLALPAVAGKFGVRGGGYTLSNSSAWKMNATAISGPEAPTRTINMNRLGAALTTTTEPPIQLLFVYNSNALMTTPNQTLVRRGLEREDLFTIVFDQVLTDTARYADLVLPATTFLEHHELSRGYGAFVLQQSAPVIAPVGQARSNYSVFADLAVRAGVATADEIPTEAAAIGMILETSGRGADLQAQLTENGFARPVSGDRPVQFVDVFPKTDDRKVHLVPVELDAEAREGLYAYQSDPGSARTPLTLISPATHRTISSTLGHLRKGPVALEMHPTDAAARGLLDGQRIKITNEHGEVHCRLHLSRDQRPGVVELPKGLWAHNTDNGFTACALAPDSFTDLGDGACFNDARVEVSAAEA
ncbi:MAG: molybdopterin-dependent oxidoreductase, partial [Thermoanaerobaculia bacterium]